MNDRPDDTEQEQDDAVIGRAFYASLIAIGALAVMIFAMWLWLSQVQPEAIIDEVAPSGPRGIGETVTESPPHLPFTDVTAASGIDFVHENGAYGDRLLPETMGSGAAFFDYDNDGDPDLLLVNATRWPWRTNGETASSRLYRNRGDGTFEDATASAWPGSALYGTGVAVGDYDDDGYKDVYLAALGENRLYRNLGGKRFKLVELGVEGGADDWSTSATFSDYDGDGDLDIFCANYVQWSRAIDFEVDYRLTGIGRAYGPPTNFAGSFSLLFRNDGDRFTDVSAAAGIEVVNRATGEPAGKALAVAPFDVDDDGDTDLIVANDTVQNFLFLNAGGGRFEERGAGRGVAYDNSGSATGAMGIDAARYNNDDDLAVAVANFANEMTSFFVAQSGTGLFTDENIVSGIGADSRRALSFGLFFFDADLDGRLDMFEANGHVENEINTVQPSQNYEQAAQIFWNCGPDCSRNFLQVPHERTGDLATPLVGRGATYADIDGDGDLDILITQAGRRAALFRNDQTSGNNWLRIVLQQPPPNRNAIGAKVRLSAGGTTQYRRVTPTRSYLSQTEFALTFGLGKAATADIEITWPDGTTERREGLTAGRTHRLSRANLD